MPRKIVLTAAGEELVGADAPKTLKCLDAYGPLFTPVAQADSKVRVLGTLEDGRAALIQTGDDAARLFFCALPNLPGSWLAAIAKIAGVTVYDDNHQDVVWAGQNALTIHALKGGPRRLNFPQETGMLKNLLTGEVMPIQHHACEVLLPDNATTLFRIIPLAE